jgi:glycine/D-amino acid oxidase-like deaminating enzyme
MAVADVAIVGGGLAGLLVCDNLLSEFDSVVVFDHHDPMAASQTPLAIYHPFPGRSLKPRPFFDECLQATLAFLHGAKHRWPETLRFVQMLRPLDGSQGQRLEASFQQHLSKYPEPICVKAFELEQWRHLAPHLSIESKALLYAPAAVVHMPLLMSNLKKDLQGRGARFIGQKVEALASKHGNWSLRLRGRQAMDSKKVILSAGRGLKEFFPELPIDLEGGEIGMFHLAMSMNHALSWQGMHCAAISENDMAVGSTRWPFQKTSINTESKNATMLLENLRKKWSWAPQKDAYRTWQGVRTILRHQRQPLLGPVSGFNDLWILGCLGSTGLMWGPWAASILSRAIALGGSDERIFNTHEIDQGGFLANRVGGG